MGSLLRLRAPKMDRIGIVGSGPFWVREVITVGLQIY